MGGAMPTRISTCGSPRPPMSVRTISRLSCNSIRWVSVQVAMPAIVHSSSTVDRASPQRKTSVRVSSAVDSTRTFDQSTRDVHAAVHMAAGGEIPRHVDPLLF